jgi:hypothetical protein
MGRLSGRIAPCFVTPDDYRNFHSQLCLNAIPKTSPNTINRLPSTVNYGRFQSAHMHHPGKPSQQTSMFNPSTSRAYVHPLKIRFNNTIKALQLFVHLYAARIYPQKSLPQTRLSIQVYSSLPA